MCLLFCDCFSRNVALRQNVGGVVLILGRYVFDEDKLVQLLHPWSVSLQRFLSRQLHVIDQVRVGAVASLLSCFDTKIKNDKEELHPPSVLSGTPGVHDQSRCGLWGLKSWSLNSLLAAFIYSAVRSAISDIHLLTCSPARLIKEPLKLCWRAWTRILHQVYNQFRSHSWIVMPSRLDFSASIKRKLQPLLCFILVRLYKEKCTSWAHIIFVKKITQPHFTGEKRKLG